MLENGHFMSKNLTQCDTIHYFFCTIPVIFQQQKMTIIETFSFPDPNGPYIWLYKLQFNYYFFLSE